MAELSSRNRVWLFASVAALLALTAGVSAISVHDPDGLWLRFGMIMFIVGTAMWMPLPVVLATIPLIWFGPNYARGQLGDPATFRTEALLELPGLIGLALTTTLFRRQVKAIEEESQALNSFVGLQSEIDQDTGVYQERLLQESIERELVRSRRFGREFAVMLAAIDPMRAKFDYREDEKWQQGVKATAFMLLNTRTHIDRVYAYGDGAFALLLPETGSKDITGLVRRLARAAKGANPPEGEPGGPLPLHFGVTFYPHCATTVDDLLRRAEVALRIAEKSPNRLQLDGAEAPDMPAPELLRKDEEDETYVDVLAGTWLGAEAPEEERGVESTPNLAVPALTAATGPALQQDRPDAAALAASSVLSEADQVAAQIWSATESAVAETALGAGEGTPETAGVPRAGIAGSATAGVVEPALQAAMSDMLKRMEETLAMFRSRKAA
jgi:diguanylate cyclase (GGDEF)-like protein